MEDRAINIKSKKNHNLEIRAIPGHFATNHSHVNYYVDLTAMKYCQRTAKEAGKEMAMKYNTTSIDSIICMDGCEIIGGFLADELTSNSLRSMNGNQDIFVITPEYNSNGQMIFRDNLQPMVTEKHILLLLASTTTGKSINRSLECIKYYGGEVVGISAIFSAIDQMQNVPIYSIFRAEDIPNYHTYPFKECPDCSNRIKIDAIVNSFGYSKI